MIGTVGTVPDSVRCRRRHLFVKAASGGASTSNSSARIACTTADSAGTAGDDVDVSVQLLPSGYPVPMDGPVGELLSALERHPFRPTHLHALIYKPGYKTIASQLYSHDDPLLETDAQFGVVQTLVGTYVRHENQPPPDPDVAEPWYSLEHTFIVEPGEAWLPTPPVTAKRDSAIERPS